MNLVSRQEISLESDLTNLETKQKEDFSHFATCTSITMSTLTSAAVGGTSGAAIGFATAIFDNFLIKQQLVTKRYASNANFWKISIISPLSGLLSGFFPSYSRPIYATAHLVLGITLPYFLDDVFEYKQKLQIPLESFRKINTLFDKNNALSMKAIKSTAHKAYLNPKLAMSYIKDYFDNLSKNEFLKSVALDLSLNVLIQTVNHVFFGFLSSANLGQLSSKVYKNKEVIFSNWSIKNIKTYILPFAYAFAALILKNTIVWKARAKRNIALKEQERLVLKRCTHMVMDKGSAVKILSTEGGQNLILNMDKDIKVLLQHGSSQIVSLVSDSVSIVLALNNLTKIYESMLVPLSLTVPFLQKNLHIFAGKIKKASAELTLSASSLWKVKSDLVNNIGQIELRDGSEYINEQYSALLTKNNAFEKQLDALKKEKSDTDKEYRFYNEIISNAFFGLQILQNNADMTSYFIKKQSMDTFHSFVMSRSNLSIESKDFNSSNARIDKLVETIKNPKDNLLNRTVNDRAEIRLNNYKLLAGGQEILHLDQLTFEKGKRYALTGKSGCGKSSVLRDIKQGLIGGMTSSGEILLPDSKKHNIMFLNQDLYFPQESTLFQTLCFPKITSKMSELEQLNQRKKVLKLFQELEIDDFAKQEEFSLGLNALLDSEKFELSGGQSKKVAIIQAILSKPAVLILDETFTGLDQDSLRLVEKAILKYLPNTLIISVDHHADHNNHGLFYQKRVHFSNQTATVSDF